MQTYIPHPLESFQINKRTRDRLVGQAALVLPQQPVARLRVLALLDTVPQVSLLQGVESDDDAVDFGEGLVKVTFRRRVGELDFLTSNLISRVRIVEVSAKAITWSRLMVAVRLLEGV